MNKLASKALLIISVSFFLFPFLNAQAQTAQTNPQPNIPESKNYLNNLKIFSEKAGFSSKQAESDSIAKTLGRMASIVISFVGTIFIIINVYSGIQWMTSGGNPKKIETARTRIFHATGGLILLALTYVLTKIITEFFA